MAEQFDPYHVWLGIPVSQQPPTHYRLLGIEQFESNSDVIDAAASRQTAYLHQLASGPNRKASQTILTEIAAARRCLLNPESKATYDQTLRDKISVPDESPATNPADSAVRSDEKRLKNPRAKKSGSRDGAGKKNVRCGQCKAKIQTTQAKLDQGLKCPKCGNQVSRPQVDVLPTINIDTTAESPTRAIKERKPVPWWAHPVSIVGAGTALLLIVAGIGKWITTPEDVPAESPSLSQKDKTQQVTEPTPAPPTNPPKEEQQDFFIVDVKKATKKGKWIPAKAPSGFVGSGFMTSNDPKASIQFDFSPPSTAPYEIRLKHLTNKRYGNTVPVKLQIRNVAETSKVNMKQPTLGGAGYRFLGVRFLKAKEPVSVELKVAGAGGHVYAESVEFIRREGTDIGICGYWSMNKISEQNPADIGGTSAVIQGGKLVDGVIGKAVQLDASDQIRLGADVMHPVQGSIAFWLRQDSKKPIVILSTSFKEAKDGIIRIQTVAADSKLKLAVQVSPSVRSPGIPIDQTIVPGEWYHIVLTWTAEAESHVYCNGKRLGQRNKSPRLSRVPIRLGRIGSGESDQSVLIDEIRVYRERALAEADVRNLFAQKDD